MYLPNKKQMCWPPWRSCYVCKTHVSGSVHVLGAPLISDESRCFSESKQF